jgi:hypothetical protein
MITSSLPPNLWCVQGLKVAMDNALKCCSECQSARQCRRRRRVRFEDSSPGRARPESQILNPGNQKSRGVTFFPHGFNFASPRLTACVTVCAASRRAHLILVAGVTGASRRDLLSRPHARERLDARVRVFNAMCTSRCHAAGYLTAPSSAIQQGRGDRVKCQDNGWKFRVFGIVCYILKKGGDRGVTCSPLSPHPFWRALIRPLIPKPQTRILSFACNRAEGAPDGAVLLQ